MDLRQEYNNIQIKEGNKQKTAFTTLMELFEPTIMFFSLTNSLATFQAMINNLLRDLINKGNVAFFIDDILVATETVEGYDKIVEEVLKYIEENDFYIKPEKYTWKVQEVGFLGVILGPDRIKIEKKKVKAVLEWLVSRNVKDIQKFLGLVNYY